MALTTRDAVVVLVLVTVFVVAVLVAGAAGALARLDGATVPAALSRAGAAFLGVVATLLALLATLLGG